MDGTSAKVLTFVIALLFPLGSMAAPSGLVISEVLYDPSGLDDGNQWIELFNATGSDIDLSSYSLGWGGADYTQGTVQLTGTVTSGGYFVVGGPDGGVTYDQIFNFAPDLYAPGGGAADGIALFDVVAASITVATVPIDAIIYAKKNAVNSNGLMDETGAVGAIEVTVGGSDSGFFLNDDGSWSMHDGTSPPTAGGGGLTAPVPEPKTAALLMLGLTMLGIASRRRS
jgi:hypothetical protein